MARGERRRRGVRFRRRIPACRRRVRPVPARAPGPARCGGAPRSQPAQWVAASLDRAPVSARVRRWDHVCCLWLRVLLYSGNCIQPNFNSPNEQHLAWITIQFVSQYLLVSAAEIMFAVSGLEFSFIQVTVSSRIITRQKHCSRLDHAPVSACLPRWDHVYCFQLVVSLYSGDRIQPNHNPPNEMQLALIVSQHLHVVVAEVLSWSSPLIRWLTQNLR